MIVELYNYFIGIFYFIQFIFLILVTFIFKKRLRDYKNWSRDSSFIWPNAEVILCLRGADQNLFCLLKALSRQCYLGNWQLKIVIDSS